MTGKVASFVMTSFLGLAITYFTWYQTVGKPPIEGISILSMAILVAAFVILLAVLLFRWFLGYNKKPNLWRHMEAEGKPYELVSKKLGIFVVGMSVLFAYVFHSLLIDLIMGQAIFDMLKFSFFSKGTVPHEVPLYWSSTYPLIYVGFYVGLGLSAVLIFGIMKGATGKIEMLSMRFLGNGKSDL